MRISELSRVSGVPLATIKYYLREGLLPEGVRTSPNQAQYDDAHVQRLRLIRALAGAGGLSLAATKSVLAQIDAPPGPMIDLLGTAHQAVAPDLPDGVEPEAALALLRRWGWRSCLDAADSADSAGSADGLDSADGRDGRGGGVDDAVAALAAALAALDEAGFVIDAGTLDTYAQAMARVAEAEIAGLPVDSPEASVRYVVLGTVLVEPVLLALRRLAQREASANRFPDAG